MGGILKVVFRVLKRVVCGGPGMWRVDVVVCGGLMWILMVVCGGSRWILRVVCGGLRWILRVVCGESGGY